MEVVLSSETPMNFTKLRGIKIQRQQSSYSPPCEPEIRHFDEPAYFSVLTKVRDGRQENRGSILGRGKTFFSQPDADRLQGHIGTGALSLKVKQSGREADHLPPSSAGAKNTWSYTTTHSFLIHGMVLIYAQGDLYLLHSDNTVRVGIAVTLYTCIR
jgi:hypothetical protein